MGFFHIVEHRTWVRGIQEWAAGPFFVFGNMRKAPPQLTALVQSAVDALGYELVGVEYLSRPTAGHLLRIYIDREGGIGLAGLKGLTTGIKIIVSRFILEQ